MGVKIYLINMADTFRQVCRGSYLINDINGMRRSLVDRSESVSQTAMGNFTNFLGMIMQARDNPDSFRNSMLDAQGAESQPQQAANDAMLFVERNNCGSSAFSTFKTHLRSYVMDSDVPNSLMATEYQTACQQGARPTAYGKDSFRPCFQAQANTVGLSRAEKKALLANFWPTATSIMNRSPQSFAMCNGAYR